MTAKIACIMAAQRTGTTALQSALKSSDKFAVFGEIFHNDAHAQTRPGTFIHYAAENDVRLSAVLLDDGCERELDKYLDHIEQLSQPRIPLIDVKLNSWNTLTRLWQFPHAEPLLMELLKRRRSHFLFVVRKSLCDQVLSLLAAQAIGKWHEVTSADLREAFTVDLKSVRQLATEIVRTELLYNEFLEGYQHVTRIAYENLYQDGRVAPQILKDISGAFDVELEQSTGPTIARNEFNKRSMILNYDEACSVIEEVVSRFGRVGFAT